MKGQFVRTRWQKAKDDPVCRTLLIACAVLCVNLVYAVMNVVLGIIHISAWHFTLFTYYAILSVMRFYAVIYGLTAESKCTDRSIMRFCGWLLCFLAIVISGVVCLNFTVDRNASKPFVLMITIATYTTWKVTMAIINIVKAHKKQEPLLIALRNIGCADAAMSILTLEHSMIATFGSDESRLMATMDGTVGLGAFLIVLLLGIGMTIRRSSANDQNEPVQRQPEV